MQLAEETLGTTEKTLYDTQFELMSARVDLAKL